ncbi:hypothetical protein BgiBS90_019147, partial [Biomphalaria glabrata]
CCDDLNIRLLDFIREDGNSECQHFFLTDDQIKIKAIVEGLPKNLDKTPIRWKFIMNRGKTNESMELFEYRKFSDCKGLNNSIAFSCLVSKEKAEVLLNLNATKSLSEIFLQLLVNTSTNTYSSEIKQIPKIL